MLFIKKCYLSFMVIGCLSFGVIISSDDSFAVTEEEGEMRDLYEGIYKGSIKGESLEDYWVAINYLISHPHKLSHPLAEVDKLRLTQLINIVNDTSLSNAEKFFNILSIEALSSKPSHHTAKMLKLFATNYYDLNEGSMPTLDLKL